jgi:hypothetical protein
MKMEELTKSEKLRDTQIKKTYNKVNDSIQIVDTYGDEVLLEFVVGKE